MGKAFKIRAVEPGRGRAIPCVSCRRPMTREPELRRWKCGRCGVVYTDRIRARGMAV